MSVNDGQLPLPVAVHAVLARYADIDRMLSKAPTNGSMSPGELEILRCTLQQVATYWTAFQMKIHIWAHILFDHVHQIVSTFGSYHRFSSNPTEARHSGFKKDLRNSWMGNRKTAPLSSKRSLVHVVQLDSINLGIMCRGYDIYRTEVADPHERQKQNRRWGLKPLNRRHRRKRVRSTIVPRVLDLNFNFGNVIPMVIAHDPDQ